MLDVSAGRSTHERQAADIPEPSRLIAHGLYAIAVERYNRQGWPISVSIEYVQASDTAHARAQFRVAEPNPRRSRIVAVGPAIGFFVEDNHGEKLSVD